MVENDNLRYTKIAQVLLAWAIQRGTALLTTSKTPSRIQENFEVSTLPEEAVREINEGIKLLGGVP